MAPILKESWVSFDENGVKFLKKRVDFEQIGANFVKVDSNLNKLARILKKKIDDFGENVVKFLKKFTNFD